VREFRETGLNKGEIGVKLRWHWPFAKNFIFLQSRLKLGLLGFDYIFHNYECSSGFVPWLGFTMVPMDILSCRWRKWCILCFNMYGYFWINVFHVTAIFILATTDHLDLRESRKYSKRLVARWYNFENLLQNNFSYVAKHTSERLEGDENRSEISFTIV